MFIIFECAIINLTNFYKKGAKSMARAKKNSPLKKKKSGYEKEFDKLVANPEKIGMTTSDQLIDVLRDRSCVVTGINESVFTWDEKKLKAAEMFAEGYRAKAISDKVETSKESILNWYAHPEFKTYVDEIILETGMAIKNMRIGMLKRLASDMERAFYIKLEDLERDPSYERLKDLSSELREILKQIGQEKEEFMEVQKNIVSGELNVIASRVENYINDVEDDNERVTIQQDFEKIADKIVNELVSGQDQAFQAGKIIDVEVEETDK